jgi:phage-related protein
MNDVSSKQLKWVGGSHKNLQDFPKKSKEVIGYALYLAQCGDKHPSAKPLKGFRGSGVLEIVENFDGNTYRVVYTVQFAEVVYVLHAFQKKSKQGIKTPKPEIKVIETRLKQAQEDYSTNHGQS